MRPHALRVRQMSTLTAPERALLSSSSGRCSRQTDFFSPIAVLLFVGEESVVSGDLPRYPRALGAAAQYRAGGGWMTAG